MDGEIGQFPGCPVIMVGYCVGGLVIKQMCLQAKKTLDSGKPSARHKKKLRMFLDNVRGIFYYGTPHHGSCLIDKVAGGPWVKYFKALNTEAARLNSDFDDLLVLYRNWKVYGLGESLAVKLGLFQGHVVVPEGASREGEEFNVVDADHDSICQPSDKVDRRYYAVRKLIISIVTRMEDEEKVREEACEQEARSQNFQALPEETVGMDAQVQRIAGKLDSVKKLGITGMGGIGKTTLAKAVFNNMRSRFEYTCFVPNMKLIAGDAKTVVWDHMHHQGKKVGGKSWSSLNGRKVLVVLDDISLRDEKVIQEFACDSAPESRFIVTSRDRELLSSLDEVVLVPFLESKDAEILFMKYAFPNQAEASKELEAVMKDIVKKCDGLPLTLEVLAKYLKGKRDYEDWEQILNALKTAEEISSLNERLWEKLRPSYNALTAKEQQIFLDATTFFCSTQTPRRSRGWTLREAKAAWRAVYGASEKLLWRTLVDRSLVYAGGEDEGIKVHEQLQSLGQIIASEPSNIGKCRVWDGDMGLKILQTPTGELDEKEIYALRVGDHSSPDIRISKGALSKLKKVRVLEVNTEVTIDGAEDGVSVPTEVVLLSCRGPELFNPTLQPHLVVLQLSGWWDEPVLHPSIGQLERLKHLTLGSSVVRTLPNSFTQLRALQNLTIEVAPLLESLPESFGQLSALNSLRLVGCRSLQTLPGSFGQLKALRQLEFFFCEALESLPRSFGELDALNHLKFRYNTNLRTLPESFGGLKALQRLEFYGCEELESLPRSFGDLDALNSLELYRTNKLRNLPESFGRLIALHRLVIRYCEELESLPQSFGDLDALNSLELMWCSKLHALPDSFRRLSKLTELSLGCENLHHHPDSCGQLANLQRSEIDATSEMWTESVGDLKGLQDLGILYYSATSIPNYIKSLPSLQRLELSFERDLVEPLPPWLITPNVPSTISRGSGMVFQVQDGCFSLIERESKFT